MMFRPLLNKATLFVFFFCTFAPEIKIFMAQFSTSHTKVIATVGPATASYEMLESLMKAGVNVFRLNFSHGTHNDHREVIERIIELNHTYDAHISMLADLQGPKLRIGEVENNAVMLRDGAELLFTRTPCLGTASKVYMSYENFAADVQPGEFVLVDDGKLKLEVLETNGTDLVRTQVVHGGILSSRKGVNLPDTKVSLPSLTPKDIEDVLFALEYNIDWIALSFVRSARDIEPLREIIRREKKIARIVAKIEKPEALLCLDDIIDASNGVMVARGDMGVEVPFYQVPAIQKEIVSKCLLKAKPVIIATQMLESMITNFMPTRAEANDVANAVLDGADAVMLSGESSTGKYPVEAVEAMQQIITHTESQGFSYFREVLPVPGSQTFLPDSICLNACRLAEQTAASTIVVFTFSGYTALKIASYRPKARIVVFTHNKALVRKMALIWGTTAFHFDKIVDIDEAVAESLEYMKIHQMVHPGEVVVHVGSVPVIEKGQTNMLRLSYV